MITPTVEVRARGRWGFVCALAVILGVTGCTAQPDAAAEDQSAPSSSASAPGPSLGPTEQPPLPVVEGDLDDEIELDSGVTVTLESISTTTVEAETPGDIPGDAIEVVVRIDNISEETQSVDSAVVTLETAEGDLGLPTIAGGAEPLSGDIAPGDSADGRYLFILDPVEGRDLVIRVNYSAGEPIAQFLGHTP